MATRGRKPKPTAMKELEGNPGKHPLNTSEPKPNKKAPACPKWLEPEAKKEWRRLAKQMEAIGILTEVDMAAFAGYCQAYARWKEAEEFMGFTVVPFGQGFKDMSPPTKEFYKLLMEGRIIHGGNPVMAWMAGNVVVDTDAAGNIKPTKAKSPEKIDGIVAAIMALDRCIRNEGQQQGSVYDERDMIVF